MIRLKKYVFLILDILHLLLLQKQVLIDSLHCIHLVHLSIVDKEYLAKGTLVDNPHNLKISQGHFFALKSRFPDQTLTITLILCVFFFLKDILGVVLVEVWSLKDDKVVVQVLIIFPFLVFINLSLREGHGLSP